MCLELVHCSPSIRKQNMSTAPWAYPESIPPTNALQVPLPHARAVLGVLGVRLEAAVQLIGVPHLHCRVCPMTSLRPLLLILEGTDMARMTNQDVASRKGE